MLKQALLVGLGCLTTSCAVAQAQTPGSAGRPVVAVVQPVRPAFCPEGRLPNGQCQNPKLAMLARLTACVATQGSISVSAGPPCTTVIQDQTYRYPNAVFADTKRQLDIAFNRRSSSLENYGTVTRFGAGTPNPAQYPLF